MEILYSDEILGDGVYEKNNYTYVSSFNETAQTNSSKFLIKSQVYQFDN